MSDLHHQTEGAYIQANGSFCPACQRDNIIKFDGRPMQGTVRCHCVCLKCGAKWSDVYQLAAIDAYRPPKEEDNGANL